LEKASPQQADAGVLAERHVNRLHQKNERRFFVNCGAAATAFLRALV
jgi:hypothetical protein